MVNSKQDDKSVNNFSSIGEYLKSLRLEKQITLDDVFSAIKIRKHYIEALENNDYVALPERTYALGYLRSYANFLEVNNVEALMSYLDNTYNFVNPQYSNVASTLDNKMIYPNTVSKPNIDVSEKQASVFSTKFEKPTTYSDKPSAVSGKNINSVVLLVIVLFLVSIIIWLSMFLDSNDLRTNDENVTLDLSATSSVLQTNNLVVVDNKPNMSTTLNNESIISNSESTNNTNIDIKNNSSNIVTKDNSSTVANSGINTPNSTQVAPAVKEESKTTITPWPRDVIAREISINFTESVWVQIYKTDSDTIYLDRVFNAGDTYRVPGLSNLSINIGNYKGLFFNIDNQTISLKSNNRNSLVLTRVKLEKQSLISTFASP